MAKLERYMFEMAGFVSIIPRRLGADESLTYSPYIERELRLARRARTPCILFVDDQVLDMHRKTFPASAIPFFRDAPAMEITDHVEAISRFRKDLAGGAARPPRQYSKRQAMVIVGQGPVLLDAASRLAAILRKEGFKPTVAPCAIGLDEAFDDIDIFESLLNSELCVFVLGKDLSYPDVLLAMTHAHCIPSVRLRFDPDAESSAPELSGAVKWKSAAELVSSFGDLLQNYQSAFATASGKEMIQQLATPEQISQALRNWDPSDGPGLIEHIAPDDKYVSDRVSGVVSAWARTETGRVQSDGVCRDLYDRIKRDGFYYTFEPVLRDPHKQRIRQPKEIDALNCGTCIDFACLFASLLEAAHQRPVVIVAGTAHGAHAVAGYVAPDAVLGTSPMTLGELRGAVNRGEIVVFETTGSVEAAQGKTVGAETEAERKEGDRRLDYRTAKNAAKRLLLQSDIELRHFVDVQQARRRPSWRGGTMASPVKLYQQEMHNNVGFFATWLPSSILELGDVGVLEDGRFRRVGSLKELGIPQTAVREGTHENMSYSAWAERKAGASAGASAAVPVVKAELSIQFTRQGGYVFEAADIRNWEIADRMALADSILTLYQQGRWQKKWLLVDAVYKAASATIIVSEDTTSEIVLNASGNVPLGSLPLADPKVGLSVSSSRGKIVQLVAQSGLSPLYSCLKVQDPLFGSPTVSPVRGLEARPVEALARSGIEELLES